MNGTVPHIVQYQGSKRKLAPQILRYMPKWRRRMIEPFSGTAAMTIAAALDERADVFVINDLNAPLAGMLEEAIRNPFAVSNLLKGKAEFHSLDYREVFGLAEKGDVIYMAPYQGVSDFGDNRYLAGVTFAEFSESLYELNRKGVDYLISYDGDFLAAAS